jgi:transcriptional regulator with XRE-family HTH domain
MPGEMGERVQGRLERLGKTPDEAAREAGMTLDTLERVLDGRLEAVKGRRLVRLADALATSVGYLVGLDPDEAVPQEWLEEDQGQFGLLAADEEALLRAYRRLDMSSRAALLQVAGKMAPEPEMLERRPRRV